MEELTDRTQAIMAAKTKGDVIAVMLADKDDADLDARKELWSSVEMLYPKYSCEFFFSTSPEVIKYYSKASKNGLPTIAVITSIGDSGQKRKKKTTHVWPTTGDILNKEEVATFIFRSTIAIVENLSGDGGPDAQARIGLAMRTSWARVMMFAPDNEVNQDMVEALEAEGVHDRTVGLHIHVDPANEQSVDFMAGALKSIQHTDSIGKKDAIKAIKAGKTIIVFAGVAVHGNSFDSIEEAITALPTWAAEVTAQAPLDLNTNARDGGGAKKNKKNKAAKKKKDKKKTKKKKAKKDSADL